MLTADDIYDVLAARERHLDHSRRAARQAATPAWNAALQEHYLRQADNLGLLPDKFSPRAPIAGQRLGRNSPTSGLRIDLTAPYRRPQTAPPPKPHRASFSRSTHSARPAGALSPRPSRSPSPSRIARALARADAAVSSSTAAAALAATDELLHRRGRRRNRWSGFDSSDLGTSDSYSHSYSYSHDGSSDAPAYPGSGESSDGSWDGVGGGSQRREGRGALYAREMERIERSGAGGGGGGGRRGRSRSPRASGGRRQRGGGGGGEALILVPTQAFLRHWRAVKKKDGLRRQVAQFLLGIPGELGGEGAAPAIAASAEAAQPSDETGPGAGGSGANLTASGPTDSHNRHADSVSTGPPPPPPASAMHTPYTVHSTAEAAQAVWPQPAAHEGPAVGGTFQQRYEQPPPPPPPQQHQQPTASPTHAGQAWAGPWSLPPPPTPQPPEAAPWDPAPTARAAPEPYPYPPRGRYHLPPGSFDPFDSPYIPRSVAPGSAFTQPPPRQVSQAALQRAHDSPLPGGPEGLTHGSLRGAAAPPPDVAPPSFGTVTGAPPVMSAALLRHQQDASGALGPNPLTSPSPPSYTPIPAAREAAGSLAPSGLTGSPRAARPADISLTESSPALFTSISVGQQQQQQGHAPRIERRVHWAPHTGLQQAAAPVATALPFEPTSQLDGAGVTPVAKTTHAAADLHAIQNLRAGSTSPRFPADGSAGATIAALSPLPSPAASTTLPPRPLRDTLGTLGRAGGEYGSAAAVVTSASAAVAAPAGLHPPPPLKVAAEAIAPTDGKALPLASAPFDGRASPAPVGSPAFGVARSGGGGGGAGVTRGGGLGREARGADVAVSASFDGWGPGGGGGSSSAGYSPGAGAGERPASGGAGGAPSSGPHAAPARSSPEPSAPETALQASSPGAAGAAAGSEAPYAVLRDRQSALSGDVQALLKRLTDMRCRLGGG